MHVRETDLTYHFVRVWLETRGLHRDARSTIARIGKSKGSEEDFTIGVKNPLSFAPWNAYFLFWFRNHLLSYRSGLNDDGFRKVEEISITCAGRSSRILEDFMHECRDEYMRTVNNKTTIFENCGQLWTKAAAKKKRPLSTVILSEKLKQRLIADVKDFVDEDTRKWFAETSMAYRRGYLLYGPPGTGKSSFCFALAGELDVDVYNISLQGTNDGTLKSLFAELPKQCVVLLEDIDAVGMSRSTQSDASDSQSSKGGKGLTLSGLLNAIDGVGSKEGRILIMTTNHVEKLDDALIRARRVDIMAEFTLADASVISQLFGFIFRQGAVTSENGRCGSAAIGRLAAEFVRKVPERIFSTAEILSHLLQYRQSPAAAVANAETWATALLRDKRQRLGNRSYDGNWHARRSPSVSTSKSTSFDTRDETSSHIESIESCSSSLAKGSPGIGLGSPHQAMLSLSAFGHRSRARAAYNDCAAKVLDKSPNPIKSSLTEVQSEHIISKAGECSDGKPTHDLSASRSSVGRDEPLSPKPLLAPSPEPDDFERAKPSPLTSFTKEESIEEGLWMRKHQRPNCQCSFESREGLNGFFVKK